MAVPRGRPAIPFSLIERRFRLASYHFAGRWCPAVVIDVDGNFSIRVLSGSDLNVDTLTSSYAYFKVASDGTVVSCPRGYTAQFKPGKISGLADAVAKYATAVSV